MLSQRTNNDHRTHVKQKTHPCELHPFEKRMFLIFFSSNNPMSGPVWAHLNLFQNPEVGMLLLFLFFILFFV